MKIIDTVQKIKKILETFARSKHTGPVLLKVNFNQGGIRNTTIIEEKVLSHIK